MVCLLWLLASENALGLVLNSPTCSINLQAKVQKIRRGTNEKIKTNGNRLRRFLIKNGLSILFAECWKFRFRSATVNCQFRITT